MSIYLNLKACNCIECGKNFLNLNTTLPVCSYVCQNKILLNYENNYYAGMIDDGHQIVEKRLQLKNHMTYLQKYICQNLWK